MAGATIIIRETISEVMEITFSKIIKAPDKSATKVINKAITIISNKILKTNFSRIKDLDMEDIKIIPDLLDKITLHKFQANNIKSLE
jgi:hypothetical protein